MCCKCHQTLISQSTVCCVQEFVTIHLPTVGEYGLEVYANEPIREGDTYTHVCQYLCAFTDRDFGAVYGQVFDRADLAHGMQASPMMYTAPGGQYATLQQGQGMQQRGSPHGGRHMYPTATQERDGTTAPSHMYRGQMEPGDDGTGMYRQVVNSFLFVYYCTCAGFMILYSERTKICILMQQEH